jgi:ribonuclease Z
VTPWLHPRLVNDPFGDPALYIEFLFQKRALLIDLGELESLSPRKILRVSDVFVSHTHMDHFAGFDRLLRVCLGRPKTLRLYGPPGFIERTEHKLAAYSWNLVQNYPTDFTLLVRELYPDGGIRSAEFHCREGFGRRAGGAALTGNGILLDEDALAVRAVVLDHGIPCLAFAVEEKAHINVWKNRLEAMGLTVGPWLRELKQAIMRGDPDDTTIRASRGPGLSEAELPLGELKSRITRIVPGQKIAYVVDAAYHEANAERIVALADAADILFIEAVFLDQEASIAARKRHLTAHQAGELARRAGVKRLVPFHFSPRYTGMEERLRAEANRVFSA